MKTFLSLCLLLTSSCIAWATHLSGGYIQVKALPGTSLQYEITVLLYLNEVNGKPAADATDVISICFGDGQTGMASRVDRTYSATKEFSLNVYRTTHTYIGPGTYTLSSAILNRTTVQNITKANDLLLTLSTTFLTNTNTVNNSPTPGFSASSFRVGVNQRAIISLAATDTEGDSLAYGLAKSLTSPTSASCTSQTVPSYVFPNDVTHQGTYKLNPRTGELIWDAPAQQGNYSVSINIYEYRNGILISRTTQEVTLSVVDLPGTPTSIPPYEPAIEGPASVITAVSDYVDSDVTLTTFPNPVDNNLQLLIQSSNPTTAVVQLMDFNGRKLHELKFGRLSRKHEQVISMDSLTPGVYLLHANIDGRLLTRKVVKK